MSTYLNQQYLQFIKKEQVNKIFELGSRDIIDAQKLQNFYECDVYAFECNPDCLNVCKKNIIKFNNSRIKLINKAVHLENGVVNFYPFDLNQYNNMGASSLLKIDFSTRDVRDIDYNRPNCQNSITVPATRLDTFIENERISNVDMLCIDLQGYELQALKSMGKYLQTVKYIISEVSIVSTYKEGAIFREVNEFLSNNGFIYKISSKFGEKMPPVNATSFSEFDALFINKTYV